MEIYTCPHCQLTFRAEGSGTFKCPGCQNEVKIIAKGRVAWDHPGEWPRAFFETVKSSLLDPIPFFGAVGEGTGLFKPWLYAVIISITVFACAAAYQAGFVALEGGQEIADAIKQALLPATMISGPLIFFFFLLFAIIGMPVATTIGIFIQAGLYHLGLIVFGSSKRDFGATFRTVCYSMGPQVFQIVPFFGGLVAGCWLVVLNIIGIKVVHDTSYAKSTAVVFLPLILCCGFILLLFATVAGGVFAALMTTR